MQFTRNELEELGRVFKLNLINSVTGIKPANLIGTKSVQGNTNLAVFSSVVHLGSNPALLGIVTRPNAEVRKHTLDNILNTECYTINSVGTDFIEKAHYTSAKFSGDISEFDRCGFEEEYLNDFPSPFVSESKLKMSMEYREHINIKSNGTLLIIGEIRDIHIDEKALSPNGYVNLAQLNLAGISGLNSYYELSKLTDFPYAKVKDVPSFDTQSLNQHSNE